MLHDGGERHREGPGQFAYGDGFFRIEAGQQGPPCRIGERGKGAIERGS